MKPSESDDAVQLLRSHDYFQGLSDDLLAVVARHLVVCQFATGDLVYRAGKPVAEIGFVVSGRLKGVIVDAQGSEKLLRFATRGEAIGMIAAAMAEPLPITVIAVEPSTLLMLDYQAALDLTAKHPSLRSTWTRKLAMSVRSQVLNETKPIETSIVVVFHQSHETRPLAQRIVQKLSRLGEVIGVFSDQQNAHFSTKLPVRPLVANGKSLSDGEIHEQIGGWQRPGRIVVDVSGNIDTEVAARLISLSQHVLWISDETNYRSTIERLRLLEAETPAIRDKVALVWSLDSNPQPPYSPELVQVSARDFKVFTSEPAAPFGAAVSNGFDRLIHHLRGICVGLALGGGAARGMAHLGVLKALEQHGVIIDRIAGTSAGAMTGLLYAAGLDPSYVADHFAEDLRASRLFRAVPRGRYWYLTYKYRRGKFDPMLRKYLFDWRMEQLSVPSSAITVDLVSGDVVVRDSGDAVNAILDSINLPLLSKPILRGSEVLIDGGFVNNVPADILVSQGCNFIIAVDVGAKIEKHFAGIGPETPAALKTRAPNSLQTLLRTYTVQGYHMNSRVMEPADVRIEPDVSDFSMAAFTEAVEIAAVGEQAATLQLPTISTLLSDVEKRLNQERRSILPPVKEP